jgi:hypothetical protein
MKKIISLAMTAIVVIMFVSSCSETCDPGLEGTKCDTEMRTKFLGSWTASDSCVTNPATGATIPYLVTLETNGITDVQEFYIKNVRNLAITLKAKMITSTTFSIPNQSVSIGSATVTVSGEGSISADFETINFTYVTATGISTETCKVTLID